MRAEQAWGGNAFWGIEANRAARGGVGGYAEVLGTLGVETELVRDTLTVGGRVALGMRRRRRRLHRRRPARQGRRSTASFASTSDLGLSLEAGLTRAPSGNFRALQGSAALVWALDGPASAGVAARPARTDFSAGVERYRRAAQRRQRARPRRGRAQARSLSHAPNLYVTGKALSAAGGGASGYTSALIGVGWTQPIGPRLHVGAELLGGAAGGGGVTQQRHAHEPRAFVGAQITPALGLRVGAGRVKAFGGRPTARWSTSRSTSPTGSRPGSE